MKYTRYDIGKENSNKVFITIIILIFIIAFILGTAIFKLLIRTPVSSNNKADAITNILNNKDNAKPTNNSANGNKVTKFIIVQGGIYQSKENADAEMNLLNKYGTPFVVIDNGKTRVLLGIYIEDQGEKILKSLTEQKVDNSKMLYTINSSDLCDTEIVEVINANIQILTKLSEKDVKAIQTDELKKWCSTLKKVDNNSKNLSLLNDILDHVNKMPKELSKDKASENYAYIYNVINKIGTK